MIGDQQDVLARLKAALPTWFGSSTPVLNGVLSGFAYTGAFIYSLYAYARNQTRILTATDGWLDMIAADFFGTGLLRTQDQTDASFLTRIRSNLFREKATRNAIIRVLQDLTGRTPIVFESERPLDTGVYGGHEAITIVGTPQVFKLDWQGNQLMYATPRTNLLLQSEFAASWSPSQLTPTLNVPGITSPDGTQHSLQLVETVTNAEHFTLQGALTTTAIPHSLSVWGRLFGTSRPYLRLRLDDGGATNLMQANFNLLTGALAQPARALGTYAGASASIELSPDGSAFRCNVSATPNAAAGTVRAIFYTMDADYTTTVAGNTAHVGDVAGGIYLFGAQLTPSILSSYIKTGASPVTVTDYTISGSGLVTWSQAPLLNAMLTWTGTYFSAMLNANVNVAGLVFGKGDGTKLEFQIDRLYGYGNMAYGVGSVPRSAFQFVAANQQSVSSAIPLSPSMSVEAWVTSATANWNDNGWAISARNGNTVGSNGFTLHPLASATQMRMLTIDNAGAQVLAGFSPANIQIPHHYVGVIDDALKLVMLYVDGVLQSSVAYAGTRIPIASAPVFIGKDDLPNRWGSGVIDEPRIYNRALSATEIAEHYVGTYNNETGLVGYWPFDDPVGALATDASGNGRTGTLTNNPTRVTPTAPIPRYAGYQAGPYSGRFGSLIMPFQALIQAYRAPGSGIPYVNGYGQPAGGYNIASRAEYASLEDIQGSVTDDDIYAAINSVRPVATTMWTQINS